MVEEKRRNSERDIKAFWNKMTLNKKRRILLSQDDWLETIKVTKRIVTYLEKQEDLLVLMNARIKLLENKLKDKDFPKGK